MDSELIEKNKQIAYFRALDSTHQCELSFYLKTSSKEAAGLTGEQIIAVRQITDTVSSLLQHIQKKINKLIITKNNKEECIQQPQPLSCIHVALKADGEDIKSDTVCKSLFTNNRKNLQFEIFQQKYDIVVNAPLVQAVHLPVIIFANFDIQPTRCKTLYTNRKLSECRWYKSQDRNQWLEVGKKFSYKTKDTDLDHFLKFQFIPRNKSSQGPVYEVISQNPVQQIPRAPRCPFEERHDRIESKLTGKEFRVVSYNTLANRYSENNAQFPYCPETFLAIDYRKVLLLKEILGYKADIICLQEIDNREYLQYFQRQFERAGYGSVFHKKGNRIPEGLCCIYNEGKFKLLKTEQLVLSDELRKNNKLQHFKYILQSNQDVKDLILKQATSLQITVLESKTLKSIVIVANTHLYYHSEANHVRLLQVAAATTLLANLQKSLQQNGRFKVTVLFCGDFNSVPGSGVFEFMTKGQLGADHGDCLKISATKKTNVGHPFQFISACGTPEFTNYTLDFKSCLDYIFYEKNYISVLRSAAFPSEDILSANVALPSQVFPSDHIALVADLKWL